MRQKHPRKATCNEINGVDGNLTAVNCAPPQCGKRGAGRIRGYQKGKGAMAALTYDEIVLWRYPDLPSHCCMIVEELGQLV